MILYFITCIEVANEAFSDLASEHRDRQISSFAIGIATSLSIETVLSEEAPQVDFDQAYDQQICSKLGRSFSFVEHSR
jgi:hypothetical protein